MNENLTDITMLLDRSGSMASIKDDVEGGLKTFVEGQKKAPGEATFSLVQFDTGAPQEVVHDAVDIQKVPENVLDFHPRGGTPLLDAMGLSIVRTGDRLRAMPEDKRPSKVMFVIFTDGYENASREYTNETVKTLVEKQTEEFKWNFMFLGADIDAFGVSRSLGIKDGMTLDLNKNHSAQSYSDLEVLTTTYRTSGDSKSLHFTDEQRTAAKNDQ
tara:strand:- start:1015 stop:1659 length:645 start_codon:yes stop_codon:yes gene_type:complete